MCCVKRSMAVSDIDNDIISRSDIQRTAFFVTASWSPVRDHKSISAKNGVGLFLGCAVSLKNISKRFARVVAT